MTIKRIEYLIIFLLLGTLIATYLLSSKENKWQMTVTERHMKQLALLESANVQLGAAIKKLDSDRAADVREFQSQVQMLKQADGISKKNNAILKESCEVLKENNKILTLNKRNLQGIANQLDEHGEFIDDVDRTMLAIGGKLDDNNKLLTINATTLKEIIAKFFKPEKSAEYKPEYKAIRLNEAIAKGSNE